MKRASSKGNISLPKQKGSIFLCSPGQNIGNKPEKAVFCWTQIHKMGG